MIFAIFGLVSLGCLAVILRIFVSEIIEIYFLKTQVTVEYEGGDITTVSTKVQFVDIINTFFLILSGKIDSLKLWDEALTEEENAKLDFRADIITARVVVGLIITVIVSLLLFFITKK